MMLLRDRVFTIGMTLGFIQFVSDWSACIHRSNPQKSGLSFQLVRGNFENVRSIAYFINVHKENRSRIPAQWICRSEIVGLNLLSTTKPALNQHKPVELGSLGRVTKIHTQAHERRLQYS